MSAYINQAQYPTEFALHQKYASSELLLNLVWTHSHIITEIALSLYDAQTFETADIDRDLLIKACLLHEVGVYQCGGFEWWIPGQEWAEHPYVQHTVVGAQILEKEGFRQEVVRGALVHAGMGLTAEDITTYLIDLPPGDYCPKTSFEWLLTYASKFHSKTPAFRSAEEISESLAKYGREKPETFAQLQAYYGLPDVAAFEQRYAEWTTSFTHSVAELKKSTNQFKTPSASEFLTPAGIIPQQNFWATPVGPV